MANLHELHGGQVGEILQLAADKQVPITVTIRRQDCWDNLHSRVLGARGPHLMVEMPMPVEGQDGHDFQPAERIHVSFKLKHYKHMFITTVVGPTRWRDEAGREHRSLSILLPQVVYRLQRRVFQRVDVPEGRIVRAAFWLGGMEAEPAGATADCPVWSGRVTNLSAGGFQAQADPATTTVLEIGDIVGVRLSFGPGEQTVFSDARFRHAQLDGQTVLLGFQFLGLAETASGREALKVISEKVMSFHKGEHTAASR